jgi:hypothetical protein
MRWEELLDQYKHRPGDLLSFLKSSDGARAAVAESLASAVKSAPEWPEDLRDWRVVLFALLQIQIGGIMSPYLRTASHQELLSNARTWGVTKTALRFVSADIDALYEQLKDEVLDLPEALRFDRGTQE